MYYENDFFQKFRKYKAQTDDRVKIGIEAHRMGWGEITITDKNGEPIPSVKISVVQNSHEFKYGCNLFLLDEMESEEKNQKYRELVKGAANMVTLPFYWNATEPEEGHTRYSADSEKMYRRPPIDLCMDFCEQNGIEPREHGLAYPYFFPKWLQNASERCIKKHFEKRCREISERYADRIDCIEVVNEMFWGKDRFFKYYRDPDFVEWCFKCAQKYFPYNKLSINEGIRTWDDEKMKRAYFEMTRNLINNGARVDAVGLHFHMFFKEEAAFKSTEKFYDPQNLWETMDWYAKLGRPLQISEVTIPAYSEDEENEALQAEILDTLCRIWFAHPSVEQIIYWNLVDGYAHAAKAGDMTAGENVYYGGLVRFDMTPKPAYYTFKNLFEKEWHTETEVYTDSSGFALFKGFWGDYTLKVEVRGVCVEHKVTLGKGLFNKFKIEI